MDGERVAEIVQARLVTCAVGSPDARLRTNAPEVGLEGLEDNPSPFARGEKRRLVAGSHDRRSTTVGVFGEDLADLRSKRDQPGLVELGQANGQQRVFDV